MLTCVIPNFSMKRLFCQFSIFGKLLEHASQAKVPVDSLLAADFSLITESASVVFRVPSSDTSLNISRFLCILLKCMFKLRLDTNVREHPLH